MKLFGLVSAVFNASYAAGEGLGPIIGGMLIDKVSFGVSDNITVKLMISTNLGTKLQIYLIWEAIFSKLVKFRWG